jgi:hypothetical protein
MLTEKLQENMDSSILVFHPFANISFIVKRVSWFKSSLLLRTQIKYTRELQFLIKTKGSILIGKYIQQMREGNQAWLGLGF